MYDLSTRTLVQSLLMPMTAASGAEEDLFVQHSPTGNQFFLLSTQRVRLSHAFVCRPPRLIPLLMLSKLRALGEMLNDLYVFVSLVANEQLAKG